MPTLIDTIVWVLLLLLLTYICRGKGNGGGGELIRTGRAPHLTERVIGLCRPLSGGVSH